jgi:hypothetical protein
LATREARLAQASAKNRRGNMLRDLMASATTWARNGLGVTLDYRCAGNDERALGRPTDFQLEESFAGIA